MSLTALRDPVLRRRLLPSIIRISDIGNVSHPVTASKDSHIPDEDVYVSFTPKRSSHMKLTPPPQTTYPACKQSGRHLLRLP